MGKYYKGIVLLLCLLFALSAYAVSPAILHNMSSGSEPDQEYGETTIEWYSTGFYDSCTLQQVSTTTPMVVSHGYLYASSATGSNGFWIAVFEDNEGALGAQVGGCSDEGTIATDADPLNSVWNQTTWSSDFPSLSASTTYWICYWTDASISAWYENPETGTGLYDAGTGTCATEPTTPSIFNMLVTVSNYVAH